MDGSTGSRPKRVPFAFLGACCPILSALAWSEAPEATKGPLSPPPLSRAPELQASHGPHYGACTCTQQVSEQMPAPETKNTLNLRGFGRIKDGVCRQMQCSQRGGGRDLCPVGPLHI
uniref:Secreted protein n=1 Tax=Knipowitschia caucasica TaxID=637954 RepID=A0AAV2KDL8_KNICA